MRALTSTEEICVRSHVSPDGSSYEGEVLSAFPSPCPACLAFFALESFHLFLSGSMGKEKEREFANMLTALMKANGKRMSSMAMAK